MLTPQEITEKVFAKAVFGGYDMTEVDDFIESVSGDYNALYKETAILKGKLKVLVEKVEEYRSTEDAMRMALLTAQRMGEEITSEANKTKEEMISNAELEVKSKLDDVSRRVSDEELRLAVAAKETSKFIELSQAIIQKHSEFLTKLEAARRAVEPELKSAQPQPAPPPPPAPMPAPPPPRPVPPPQQMPQQMPQQVSQQMPQQLHQEIDDDMSEFSNDDDMITFADDDYIDDSYEQAAFPEDRDDLDDTKRFSFNGEDDFEDEVSSPRPKFDFDDLKFGANFDLDD